MKFADGNWQVPANLALEHPVYVHRTEVAADRIVIYAANRDLSKRADQINAKLFTVTLSSPREGILGVRIDHFLGRDDKGPHFELTADAAFKPTTSETATHVSLTTGNLTARIEKKAAWKLEFRRGAELITASGFKSGGYAIDTDTKRTYLWDRLDLGIGGLVYGLGERFTAFVKNGQSVDIWNRDGGANTDQAYKNIPFFLTNKGWGVLVNHAGNVQFEIGSEKVSKAQFSVPGESLEYFVIDGPTPKEVLGRYTDLTGKSALPPPWSFGLWLTTSFTTDYDEKTVTGFLDGMRDRNIPLHVFHFDCFWMRGLNWCDFEWDPEMFPDPEGMLARYKARGLKICVWINPYIGQASPLFAEGKKHGYLIKRPDGSVWQWDRWQPGQAVVDFTNPEACTWFAGHLKRLMAQGVDCFKTDFGERIPVDVAYHDGSDPETMHNYYAYLYNKVVFEAIEEVRGKNDAAVFARSASVGGQKFPVHWGGDCYSDFDAMAESLRGGLSLGLSGFGFWSHDIGGFEYTAEADVYKRWCAFGLLSSHSRLHGSKTYRVPWHYDQEAEAVLSSFVRLKCQLMPYLFAESVETTKTGVPLMRAMLLEFPDDIGAETLDRQYMLGPNLLVAPVLTSSGDVSVYLPEGRWTQLLTGEVVDGRGWRRENHGLMTLPLYVRPNTLVAFGAVDDRPDYDYADGTTFALYELEDGKSATARICRPDGSLAQEVTVTRSGNSLKVSTLTDDLDWTLKLVGIRSVASAGGASVKPGDDGAVVAGRGSVTLTL